MESIPVRIAELMQYHFAAEGSLQDDALAEDGTQRYKILPGPAFHEAGPDKDHFFGDQPVCIVSDKRTDRAVNDIRVDRGTYDYRVICVMVPVKFSTGAPTVIPSKSFGKRCARISACRPPVEQPSK